MHTLFPYGVLLCTSFLCSLYHLCKYLYALQGIKCLKKNLNLINRKVKGKKCGRGLTLPLLFISKWLIHLYASLSVFKNNVSSCLPIIKSQHHMVTVHPTDLVVDKVNFFQITGCHNTSELRTNDMHKASLHSLSAILLSHILKPKLNGKQFSN